MTRLVSFWVDRFGLISRRRRLGSRSRRRRQQIDNRRRDILLRCLQVDGTTDVVVANQKLAGRAVLCGCRSWLPVAVALGSSVEAAVGLRAAAAGGSPADPVALRFLRRLACAGTVAAGRARSASGEGLCTDPSKVRCTNSSPCDLPKPALAAFGMDSARTKTHGRATVASPERWYVSHI